MWLARHEWITGLLRIFLISDCSVFWQCFRAQYQCGLDEQEKQGQREPETEPRRYERSAHDALHESGQILRLKLICAYVSYSKERLNFSVILRNGLFFSWCSSAGCWIMLTALTHSHTSLTALTFHDTSTSLFTARWTRTYPGTAARYWNHYKSNQIWRTYPGRGISEKKQKY